MKKFALMLFAAFMAVGFTACSDDDNKGEATETVSGFYTINGGNMSGKIPASITAYDYATGTATKALEDAFFAANEIALGEGAQQALVYNDKMYIVMYRSNLIWVVEPTTLKIITSIKPEGDAMSPRAITAKDGKLYCSMYTGYVVRIDAKTDEIDGTLKVGPNPDGVALAGNKLVVANTDGQNSKNKYANNGISVIDLATFTQTEIKNTKFVGNHPTEAVSNGTDAFVIMQGSYTAPDKDDYVAPIIVKVTGASEADITKVCEGSLACVAGDKLYVAMAPFGLAPDKITYKIYDVNTFAERGNMLTQVKGQDSEIESPNGVFVNPANGDIIVLSYYYDSASNKAFTKEPCYANIYDASGNFKKRIECGVGARAVTFINEKIAK